eukprot:contig_10194_g2431
MLILRIVGGTLDPSLVPYQFVWEGAPLPLLRYAAGLPLWFTFAVMMKTGGIESSSEYIVLFTIFTATILWVYALQFTMLWVLRCDWELFSAVAWARELLKSLPEICPVARPVKGHCTCDCVHVAARVGDEADAHDSSGALQEGEAGNWEQVVGEPEGRNYAVRMRVLAGRGFSHIAQLVEWLADMGTCESPLRVLQAVPLGVAVVYAVPILVVVIPSDVLARLTGGGFVTLRICLTYRVGARGGRAAVAVIRIYANQSAVLPRVPAWGLWVFSQTQSEASSFRLLRGVTGAETVEESRLRVRRELNLNDEPSSDRQMLLSAVVLLVNSAAEQFDWERVALSECWEAKGMGPVG